VKTEIVKDIKGILRFYQALGFDALPISFEAVKRIYRERKNDSRVVDSSATPGFI